MIDKAKIDEINEKTDIVELVSQYTKLTKSGSTEYKGLCPFHDEKTPSFMVSTDKTIATCFGCHKGGRPIRFLQQIKGLSFTDACIELAEKANIELDVKRYNGPDYSKYYKLMAEAANFYQYTLLNTESGKKALEYLKKRGITEELIKEFNIGLAPNQDDVLYQTLKYKNYNELDMIDCALVKKNDETNEFYDMFKNRIMFPVSDKDGNVIAFSGRIFNNEPDQPKYINSSETVIFKKNQALYHIDKARSQILKTNRIILHEGQMDVIAATKAGFGEAVCSMGTALTQNQVKLIYEFTDKVILCYDGDSAGINSMIKAIKLIKAENLDLSIVKLPDGLDPDEYVNKYGADEYKKYFESNIKSPNDFIYEYIRTDKTNLSLDEIESIKNKLFRFLNTLSSRVLVEGYLKRFSEDTGVSFASLMVDYRASLTQAGFIDHNEPQNINPTYNTNRNTRLLEEYTDEYWSNLLYRLKAQLKLFKYAMISKENAKKLDAISEHNIPLYYCFDEQHQSLWVTLINDYYEYNDTFNEGLFLKLLNSKQYNCWISDISSFKSEFDDENFSPEEIDSSINACYKSYETKVFSEQNKDFSNLNDDEKINRLKTKLTQMRAINKRKKKEK